MSLLGFSGALFVSALIATLALTPVVRAFARRIGAVDHPDGSRKLHHRPVPKLGGIAVFCGFYLAIAVALPYWEGTAAAAAAASLASRCFLPALLILFLGIADDLWPVKPWMKVAIQIVAALLICWHPDLRIAKLSNPFGMTIGGIGILSVPLTVVWIVLITNAFNLVDGVDGLASGVAFVSIACLFLAAIQLPDSYVPLLIAPLAGALMGFLRYNFAPASIFLGDSGSLSIGFLIAVISLAGETKSSAAIAVAAPLLSLAVPLLETGVSMLRRFLRGQPLSQGDSSHIHHQLLKRGFSARRAALVLYAGAALFGAASLLLVDSTRVVGGLVTIVLVIVAWLGIQQLGYSEFTEVHHAFKRGFVYQRRIIQNSILVRNLAEDLRGVSTAAEGWPLLVDVLDQLGFARARVVGDELPAVGDGLASLDWVSPERYGASAADQWLNASVHVNGTGPDARVELWRSRAEDPLHSELAVLFDVISREFPRLLARPTSEHAPTSQGAIERRPEHSPQHTLQYPSRA